MKLVKHCLSAAITAAIALPSLGHAFELEEIVVTATKRATSAQDVPIAITAIGAEALESGNFSDIRSITAKAPSVNITNSQTSSGSTSVKIRGVGTVGNNAGFESSVGIFIDGVYQARPGVALSEFVDMEQVEVLRGPQGTLFGRNTSVGALNIKTKAPVLGETEGFVGGTLGNYNLKNYKGAYNIAAGEDLAFRVAGSVRTRDGVIDSLQDGVEDAHDKDRYLLRAQALWEPTEDVSLRMIADASNNEESCCTQVGLQSNTNGSTTPGVSGFESDDFASDGDARGDSSEQQGLSAELKVELDVGTLTWIPAYRESEAKTWGDNDWTSVDLYTISEDKPNESNVESMTQELRLQGVGLDDSLDWLVGFYYSDEKIVETANYLPGAAHPLNAFGAHANNRFQQDGESWAIFTHNIFALTDDLNLAVGLRYTEEEKSGGLLESTGQNPICSAALPPIICQSIVTPASISPYYDTYEEEFSDDALTYSLNLQYHLNEDVSVYGALSTGFKSGGVNLDITGSGGTFKSEEVTAYELGLKSSWLDGRVTANAAWYYMDMEDFQLSVFNASNITFSVFNVAEAKSEGFELDVVAQLAENFVLNTSYSYQDASFPENCNGDVTHPDVLAICGNTLPNAPENILVTGFQWDVDLADDLIITVSPSVRWEDEQRPMVQPGYTADSSTMVDMSILLTDSANTWSVELWGKNLLNEAKESRAIRSLTNRRGTTDDSVIGFVSDPLTFGLTGRYNF